mgnify:CR=1 FL=1
MAVLLSILVLSIDQYTDKLKSFRGYVSLLIVPLQYGVDLPISSVQNLSDFLLSYQSLHDKYTALQAEQANNQLKLLKFSALEQENIRLRTLFESSFKLGEQVLVAELVSVNLARYEHQVLVNKGERFGVHEKQPVLDALGVVGQVTNALPLTSEIILITDPNHAIPVQVNRNGLHTIALGSGQLNKLILPFLPNNADIVPGDLLITSGLGGVFPQGYPVAEVVSFTVQPDKPFAIIEAKPKAALNTSRELLIVWKNQSMIPLGSKSMTATDYAED